MLFFLFQGPTRWFVQDRSFHQWRHRCYSVYSCWPLHSAILPISRTSFNNDSSQATQNPTIILVWTKLIIVKVNEKNLRLNDWKRFALIFFSCPLKSTKNESKMKNVISETFCHELTTCDFFPPKQKDSSLNSSSKRSTTKFQIEATLQNVSTYFCVRISIFNVNRSIWDFF